jgi:hypothetical protein
MILDFLEDLGLKHEYHLVFVFFEIFHQIYTIVEIDHEVLSIIENNYVG